MRRSIIARSGKKKSSLQPQRSLKPPPSLSKVYGQTYLVRQGEEASREAFFHCGNHLYSGEITLSLQHAFGEITLKDVPSLVPIVQHQQENLTYLCDASNLPPSNSFYGPIRAMEKARDFVVTEIVSDSISSQMMKLKDRHPWLDDDDSQSYFELVGDASSLFTDVLFIASRVYSKGLSFVTIYFEGVMYVTLEDGTGDQPLLDINFPNISGSGQGATLAIYDDDGKGRNGPWVKLSVWQAQADDSDESNIQPVEIEPIPKDLSSDCYIQSYCILKSEGQSEIRDVMFRFGSWCYDGKIELVPKIDLSDIPYVIPALRVQQSMLKFVSDISGLPSSSPFALAMENAAQKQPSMEAQAVGSEGYLRNLITTVENGASSQNGQHWLEDDTCESFFEFSCFNGNNSNMALGNVELFASKTYNPNGVISITLYFQGNWYLSLILDETDDSPLLDSKFPDLSSKGNGYNIQCYPSGISGWSELRKMSIWRIGGEDDEFDLGEDVSFEMAKHNTGPSESTSLETDASNVKEDNNTISAVSPEMAKLKSGPSKSNSLKSNASYAKEDDCISASNESDDGVDGVAAHQEPTINNKTTKLKEKMDRVRNTGGIEQCINLAWGTGGRPVQNAGAGAISTNADTVVSAQSDNYSYDDDGDIYTQLDKLDQRLDRELQGLNGLL